MFRISLAICILLLGSFPVQAQKLAEQMTCDQLISAFERDGIIYKSVHGKRMAMKAGVPIRQAQGLQCGPRNYTLQKGTARTVDERSCVYSLICYGKTNTEMRRYN